MQVVNLQFVSQSVDLVVFKPTQNGTEVDMKHFLQAAFLLGGICASASAMAQSAATGTVNVNATVLATCRIAASATPSAGILATVDFSNTVATPSATIAGAGVVQSGALSNNAVCNVASHIKLETQKGASTTAAAAPPSHQNFFDYTAVATYHDATVTLNTNVVAPLGFVTSTTATSGPHDGALVIAITSVAPTLPLVVGTYNDVLTITLTAN